MNLQPIRHLTRDDDRQGFDCGRVTLNHWLRRHAIGNEKQGTSRTYIVRDEDEAAIAAFVALTAGSIRRDALARRDQRNAPDLIPLVVIGQLAVDLRYQGIGLGGDLLTYALKIGVTMSTKIGVFGVMTYPLDDGLRGFYERWEFRDIPADPKRGMIASIKDLMKSGFDGSQDEIP